MKPITLYKKGCDPYTVHSQEALTFHKNQGWVEDPDKVEVLEAVVAPPKPYIVGDTSDAPTSDIDPTAATKIKDLEEIVATKEAMIAEMQTDFEEVVTGLNTTITRLKEQIIGEGLVPVTEVPVAPKAPRKR
jgi:hypothetical protein